MNDFQYYTPTKVVFGRGTEEQAGQLVKEQGGAGSRQPDRRHLWAADPRRSGHGQ